MEQAGGDRNLLAGQQPFRASSPRCCRDCPRWVQASGGESPAWGRGSKGRGLDAVLPSSFSTSVSCGRVLSLRSSGRRADVGRPSPGCWGERKGQHESLGLAAEGTERSLGKAAVQFLPGNCRESWLESSGSSIDVEVAGGRGKQKMWEKIMC